ncbi:MAG: hypothetical protein NTX25_09170 [Proteobacteria bacterium]|nr:hypothetical protein [Pseudomonadota bacterium]
MNSALWLLAAAATNPYPAEAPLAVRQAWLQPYFSPEPGALLSVTDRAVARERRDPLLVKGELWIKPPRGVCFILQFDLSKRDKRICKDTPIEWDVYDLDAVGQLHLNIGLDADPEMIYLSWPSPYRVANFVPLGEMKSLDNYNIPIHRCVASDDGKQRKITLYTMDHRIWYIILPEYDSPVKVATEESNLKVKTNVSNAPPAGVLTAPTKDEKPRKQTSMLSLLLSGGYKKAEKEPNYFRGNPRISFEMSSSGFLVSAVPQGMQGQCRYQFTGAPGDPKSGLIECYDTDEFDTIFTHVTCFSELKPHLRPENDKNSAKQP